MEKHVFVIDDDEQILELYRLLLEPQGYQVTVARRPYDIEEIQRLQPDVVILDILFGGTNIGRQLFEQLRQDPLTMDIPLILCSAADSSQKQSLDALKKENVHVIYKPFDLDNFLHTVQKTCKIS